MFLPEDHYNESRSSSPLPEMYSPRSLDLDLLFDLDLEDPK